VFRPLAKILQELAEQLQRAGVKAGETHNRHVEPLSYPNFPGSISIELEDHIPMQAQLL
jgi:hypothetical protein